MSGCELPLRRIRTRFLLRVAIALLCDVLLCVALSEEPLLITPWRRIATVLALLNVVPLLIVEWVNWRMARRGVSEMWAFGQLNFDQVSHMLVAQRSAAA